VLERRPGPGRPPLWCSRSCESKGWRAAHPRLRVERLRPAGDPPDPALALLVDEATIRRAQLSAADLAALRVPR